MNKPWLLLLLFFLLGFLPCQAEGKTDSLEAILKKPLHDSIRGRVLGQLCAELNEPDPKKCLGYAQQCLEIGQRSGSKELEARGYFHMGIAYDNLGEHKNGFENSFKALALFDALHDEEMLAAAYANIGMLYEHDENDEKALENYLKAAEIGERLKLPGIANTYNNIGNVYFSAKRNAEALVYYEKALKLCSAQGDLRGMAYAYNNIGTIYYTEHDIPRALAEFQKALKLKEEIGDRKGIVSSCANIGELLGEMDRFPEAIEHLNRAKGIAMEINNRFLVKEIYKMIAGVYTRSGNYKEAYAAYTRHIEVRDSLFNEQKSKELLEMQTKYETEKKDKDLLLKDTEIARQELETRQKAGQRNIFIGVLVVVVIISFFIWRGYRQKQKANEILEDRNKLEIMQKRLVEERNKDITDSINYARRIQNALMPDSVLRRKLFPQSFIVYQPRDIVSGDFFWLSEKNGKRLIAAADCTGHGVPGAFMSMLGNAFLSEIVNEKGISEPGLILGALRDLVKGSLKQTGAEGETKDGMDIALLSLDETGRTAEFAGANNPLWILRKGAETMEEFEPDRRSIGYFKGLGLPFTTTQITLGEGDQLYIFSDGYADQFGGSDGKKFKYKKLEKLLISIRSEPMEQQAGMLMQHFNDWKGKLEQVDDVLLIGIRV